MNKIVIANSAAYFDQSIITFLEKKGYEVLLITQKSMLTIEILSQYQPKYVFFMHWSYIISEEIYQQFECVIFHMTDLPFGRGGSPLQNLIANGITQTKISAIRCVQELDSGAIYLKKDLTLTGTAQEIYLQASKIMIDMIDEIITTNPEAYPQIGKVSVFKRRNREDGNIANLEDLVAVFNHIRMLDAEGYPRAYIETEKLCFEFERAAMKNGEVIADVRIRKKNV